MTFDAVVGHVAKLMDMEDTRSLYRPEVSYAATEMHVTMMMMTMASSIAMTTVR